METIYRIESGRKSSGRFIKNLKWIHKMPTVKDLDIVKYELKEVSRTPAIEYIRNTIDEEIQ